MASTLKVLVLELEARILNADINLDDRRRNPYALTNLLAAARKWRLGRQKASLSAYARQSRYKRHSRSEVDNNNTSPGAVWSEC